MMSRTHKDAPYWVRLNRESISTHHDHLHLGGNYYKYVPALDENDNQIYDETDWGFTAQEITNAYAKEPGIAWCPGYLQWYRFFKWNEEHPPISRAKLREARNFVAQGRGENFVICGQYQKARTLKVPYVTVADHCTEGELLPDEATNRRRSKMPCTPAQPDDWSFYKVQTRGMSKAKTHIRSEINGHIRVTERDHLNQVVNAWNSGYEVEDYDEDVNFTKSQPDPWAWYLY